MKKQTLLFILFLSFYSSSCSSKGPYKISDHYNGEKFVDPNGLAPKSFFDVIKWKLSFQSIAWPDDEIKVTPNDSLKEKETTKMVVTFINHASFLIQVDGFNILTDPVWSNRVSPVSFAGPKRIHRPGIDFEKLPKIDLVLISHNHYDHMDSETISALEKKFTPLFVVPLANAEKMKSFGATRVHELDWWESLEILPTFKVHLTPAQHWSSRSPFDRNKALWGSFWIESQKEKIYFAGDTGYGPHFKETYKRLGAPTLALLPIGAYMPRWFMRDAHMNPEDAVVAHLDLHAKKSLGMHFGSFQLTDEAIDSPVKDLEMAMRKLNVTDFLSPIPGQSFEF